jgi:hypothetical protein
VIATQTNQQSSLASDMPIAVQERVLELETENARLRRLVAELLVTNQHLRECSNLAAATR